MSIFIVVCTCNHNFLFHSMSCFHFIVADFVPKIKRENTVRCCWNVWKYQSVTESADHLRPLKFRSCDPTCWLWLNTQALMVVFLTVACWSSAEPVSEHWKLVVSSLFRFLWRKSRMRPGEWSAWAAEWAIYCKSASAKSAKSETSQRISGWWLETFMSQF